MKPATVQLIRTTTTRQKAPVAESTPIGEWQEIGLLDDIPVLGSRVVESAGGDIAVFRTADDRVFAVHDKCPHKGGPLSQGIVHGTSVSCPLHNWKIDLASGEAIAPDVGCTRRFEVRLDGRRVMLRHG